MKFSQATLGALAVLAAFALGRWGLPAPGPQPPTPRVENPVEAIGEALAERDALLRAYGLSVSLQRLNARDLPAIARLLEERQRQLNRETVRLIMMAWNKLDGRGAFEWALEQPGKWGQTLAAEAIYAWGFREGAIPLAALEELEGDEDAEFRHRLTASALDGWLASGEHAGASGHIAAIDDPRVRRKRGLILASEIAKDGPEALVDWAESIPEDAANDFKVLAFYNASGIITRDDPRRAMRLVEAHMGQPYIQGSLPAVARRWVQHHDPPELFAWLETLPAGDERDTAIGDGFRVWHRKQAEAAERWLDAALPAPHLDPAIFQLVRVSAQETPRAATVWAARVEDRSLRKRGLMHAGRHFWRRSPQAAAVWLETLDLPEAAKESIRRGPQRMRPGQPAPLEREDTATGPG